MSLTAEELKSVLSYDPDSGEFTWLVMPNGRVKVGSRAGTACSNNYFRIKVYGRKYQAHRLAWLYVHGAFPPDKLEIDHINGDKLDNRISNLRLATRFQNQANVKLGPTNTSGAKGVHWHKREKRWRAVIGSHGKKHYLGSFTSVALAKAAYDAAAKSLNGEFRPLEQSS